MKFLTLTNKQSEYVSHITYSLNIKLSGCGGRPQLKSRNATSVSGHYNKMQ